MLCVVGVNRRENTSAGAAAGSGTLASPCRLPRHSPRPNCTIIRSTAIPLGRPTDHSQHGNAARERQDTFAASDRRDRPLEDGARDDEYTRNNKMESKRTSRVPMAASHRRRARQGHKGHPAAHNHGGGRYNRTS